MYKSKSKLQLVAGFYNPFLVASIILVYIIIYYFPFQFLPDYWHISEIQNLRPFIWSLLSTTLGFSGLILTLLILTYNFFIKSTKRNTVEFIFENPALKILFSGFVSILLVQVAAYCMLNRENVQYKYAVVYFLLILTVSYILAQLPIAILGLKYSTSIEKINKIFNAIDFNDIDYLVNTANFLEKHEFEEIEGNRIILLKDIGSNAIKDGDWILPQKILNNFFNLIHQSVKNEYPVATSWQALYVYLWTSKHFQRTAIRSFDYITVNVIVSQALNLYYFLAEHKIYDRDLISHLDNYTKELGLSIIQSKDFADIRDNWIRDYTEIMLACLSSLNYNDEELPTEHYIYNGRANEINYPNYSDYYQFWHHLNHTQIANLIDIIEYAIEQKDNRFCDTSYWQIRHLMNKVTSIEQLTESQKREYLSNLLYKAQSLDNLANEKQSSYKLSVVSHIEIEKWAKNSWTELYRSAMYYQLSLVKSLIKAGGAYNSLLNDMFLLGRNICNDLNDVDHKIKEEILTFLLETGLKLYDNTGDSLKLKYDL